MLYNVSFTTRKLIKKLDRRGKVIAEERLDTPIVLTALPHAVAMSYSKADNFVMTTYEGDTRRTAKTKDGRDNSVGNGTFAKKHRDYDDAPRVKVKAAPAAVTAASAAETGDMSAALNH